MIWGIAFWGLLALGVLAVLWGLLWDRPGFRGRPARRCRACWYDLSDAGEVPVKCTECGRVHERERSLRRVRRHKRLVLVGLLVLVAAYSIRTTPAIKQRGVWAAVPSWVLILGIHQTPEYVQNPDVAWRSVAYGDRSPLERAMRELHVRARVEGLGWFDYQLVAWLARTEGREGLCVTSRGRKNGVYPRATSYKILFEKGIRRGQLGEFHFRWFRRLVRVDVESRASWPAGSRVFGKPKIVNAFGGYMKDPQLRVRLYDPFNGTSIFAPSQSYPPHQIQELDERAKRYNQRQSGTPVSIASGEWDDGVIELKPRDPSDNFAYLQVTVSEFVGESGSVGEPETVVDRYEMHVPVHRTDSIDQLVTVVSDHPVINEIQRCIRAEGYW